MVWILLMSMVLLLFLGFPFFISLLSGPIIILFVYFPDFPRMILIQQLYGGVQGAVLTAIPLFILAANIMTTGQSAQRLIDVIMAFSRHIHGGLAITVNTGATLFGAISGSTQATVAAIGGPMRPELLKGGYPSSFSLALIINASDIAFLIPPSLGMIIYGFVSRTSIREIFIAGIGPGILISVLFSVYCYIYARFHNIPIQPKATWYERFISIKRCLLAFGFPIIIIGGIYTGFCSPTEAAALSVLYAVILECFIYKSLKLKDFYRILLSTGVIVSVVFILLGAGYVFSFCITYAKIPEIILTGLLGSDPSRLKIMSTIIIVFFFGCMFVDALIILIVLTPIFHPIAVQAGIDPVLVAIIVILQCAIGSATPPFGCDIFTAIAIFRRPYLETVRGTPPFIFLLILATIIIILFPEVSLSLRDMAFK